MILGFTQKINKKPNYFVRKIWSALVSFQIERPISFEIFDALHLNALNVRFDYSTDFSFEKAEYKPKIHTIRAGNRWRVGMMIDFFINTRTINMFRFAPKTPAKHVQNIKIRYIIDPGYPDETMIEFYIDNKLFCIGYKEYVLKKIYDLAINDGFESAEDFLNYFNKEFTGQIIFWAGDKY